MSASELTKEAWAVLVWLAARDDGIVRLCSVRHADSLSWVADPSAALEELKSKELIGGGTHAQYGVTIKGRHLLWDGG